MAQSISSNSHDRIERVCLGCAVFATGAAVMIIEIVGARILSPFFGVGLFAWSALIAVTLASLAIGYAVGGRLSSRPTSDSQPNKRGTFSTMILASGALVAIMPLETRWILGHLGALDVRLGTLLAGSFLFAPALLALGTLSPLAVGYVGAARSISGGQATGRVFAISTTGSLAGTLVAGFVLIPNLPLTSILTWTSATLLSVGIALKTMAVGRRASPLLLMLCLPWILANSAPNMEPMPGVRILESQTSLYGHLEVVEDTRRAPNILRLLRSDQSFLGGLWLPEREPAFGFVHLLEAIRLARPNGSRMLLVGLGTGSLVTSLRHSGIETDVIEIDPQVVRLAKTYFGFEPTGTVHTEDARTVLNNTSSRYDYIVHDTFTGGSMPAHMLTRELFEATRGLLRPHGIVALNVVGAASGPLSAHVKAIASTLRSVFAEVRIFRDGEASSGDDTPLSNLVFFAALEPIVFETARPPFESPTCAKILSQFSEWEVAVDSTGIPPITDAQNPLEWLAIPMNESFRETMLELYPPAFWLN